MKLKMLYGYKRNSEVFITSLFTHSYLRLGELYLMVEVQAFPVKFHQNGGGKYGLFQRPYMVN